MSEQKEYPALTKKEHRKLKSLGFQFSRMQSKDTFGTFITGGINGKGVELHYKVEFLTAEKVLENSELLWCRNFKTGEFGIIRGGLQ